MQAPINISLLIEGGIVQDIRSDYENIKVTIIDLDNLAYASDYSEEEYETEKAECKEQQIEHNKLPFSGF